MRRSVVKVIARMALAIGAVVLIGLPIAAEMSGRDGLTLPFVAVALAALCSFLAYRAAVALRRRIDDVGASRGPGRRADSDR